MNVKNLLITGLITAGLMVSLFLSIKSCSAYQAEAMRLKKAQEQMQRIYRQISQSDQRTQQNERIQIHVIRNTPDTALAHELNRLFKGDSQAGLPSPAGQTRSSGSPVSGGPNRGHP